MKLLMTYSVLFFQFGSRRGRSRGDIPLTVHYSYGISALSPNLPHFSFLDLDPTSNVPQSAAVGHPLHSNVAI